MDGVFKALDDGSRRRLLDALFERDGRSLGELTELLPGMTRYGVMNHLRVLEETGLVTTRRDGRRKLHYLNPVPIRLVHDRWISKYTEPAVAGMTRLKKALEEKGKPMTHPVHVYQIFINVPPSTVWDAIVDGDQTVRYFYGTRLETRLEAGSELRYLNPDGSIAADGHIVACDPERRLEMVFQARWDPDLVAEGPAREAWILEEINGATKLTVELYDVAVDSKTFEDFSQGFPYILSGLKTLVETGKSLPAPH